MGSKGRMPQGAAPRLSQFFGHSAVDLKHRQHLIPAKDRRFIKGNRLMVNVLHDARAHRQTAYRGESTCCASRKLCDLRRGIDKEHPGAGRQFLAVHQPLCLFVGIIGNFNVEPRLPPIAAQADRIVLADVLSDRTATATATVPPLRLGAATLVCPNCCFPCLHLCGHNAAFAVDHPHRQSLARLQIGQARLAQDLDMQKHIFVLAKDIGKSKSLGLVKPFDTRRLQRRIRHRLLVQLSDVCQHRRLRTLRVE